MKREIEFRGKTAKGEWVYGYYCPCVISGFPATPCIVSKERLDNGCWTPEKVIPETVGQYTGLTDKNGKKIFEGDIVRVKGKQTEENWKDYNENGKVFFENGAFLVKVGTVFNGKKYFSEVHCRYMITADWVEREVIGTIFDKESDNGD